MGKKDLTEKKTAKKKFFTLRSQMVCAVQIELLVCIFLAYLIDKIAHMINPEWSIPILLELVIIGVIVGGSLTSFVSWLFFDPIKKIRQAMDTVAEGDFSVQLNKNETASGEIRRLYEGFNLMVRELRATEVLQTDFVSNVSHEFKTPINAIEGYTTLLQSCENLDEEQSVYIEKILHNTSRLSTLVSNILLLSKIENQSIPARRERYCLDEQIREAILDSEALWSPKQIDWDVELDRAEYIGHEQMMRHVWNNILSNAIKFSPQAGTVKIKLKDDDTYFVFTAEDKGPGLSDEAKKHLFDKFYQADTSHKEEGNGLGLALVKKILTIEGGEISADNSESGGCKITVKLLKRQ